MLGLQLVGGLRRVPFDTLHRRFERGDGGVDLGLRGVLVGSDGLGGGNRVGESLAARLGPVGGVDLLGFGDLGVQRVLVHRTRFVDLGGGQVVHLPPLGGLGQVGDAHGLDGRGGVQREDLLLVAVHVADLGPAAICILVFDLAVDDRVTALFRLDEAELLGLAGLGVGDGEGGVGLDAVAAGGLHPEERAVVTVDDGLRIDVLMPCRGTHAVRADRGVGGRRGDAAAGLGLDEGIERLHGRAHDDQAATGGLVALVVIGDRMRVGLGESGLRGCVGRLRGLGVTRERLLGGGDVVDGGGGQVVPVADPRFDLVEHVLVAGVRAVVLRGALQRGVDGERLAEVGRGGGAAVQLALEFGQDALDVELAGVVDGLIVDPPLVDGVILGILVSAVDAAVVEDAHVHGEVTQATGALGRDRRVVVDVAEGVLPGLLSVLFALPQVPAVVGGHEDALLARLGLLHRVEHDAVVGAVCGAGLEEVVLASHDQVLVGGVAVHVGARPVDPHERGATGVLGERVGEVLAGHAEGAAAGHDDLHVGRDVLVPGVTGSGVAVQGRAVEDRVLEALVLRGAVVVLLLLQLVDPAGQVLQHAHVGVVVAVLRTPVGGVVGEQCDLAYAGVNGLHVLGLEFLEVLLVVLLGVEAEVLAPSLAVVMERRERVNETHLRLVAGLGLRLDLVLDLVFGVQAAPVVAVQRIVLGGVHVGVHLVVAAPGHQVHAVLGAPRAAVIALDEAAGLDVGPVAEGQVADGAARQLLEDLVQGSQAVERGIGVATEHEDRVGRLRVALTDGKHIGVVLGERAVVHLQGAVGDQLLGVLVDHAVGSVDADQHVELVRGFGHGVGRGGLDALELQGLVQTGLGGGIDSRFHDGVRLVAQNQTAVAILGVLRLGVDLVLARLLGRAGVGRRAAVAGRHGRNRERRGHGDRRDGRHDFA